MRASGVEVDTGEFRFSTVRKNAKRVERPAPDLGTYVRAVFGHVPYAHHQLIIDETTACLDSLNAEPHLLIIMPPGAAKSTYVSHAMPPWQLGRQPKHRILSLTASDAQARKFHVVVRDVLEGSAEHRAFYPKGLPDPRRGWNTDGLYLDTTPIGNPGYRSVGFGTNILGSRADTIILDDLLDEDDSRSPLVVEKSIEYLSRTVFSRKDAPENFHVVGIMTHFGIGDIPSYLKSRGDFKVVTVPALTPIEAPPSDEFDLTEWRDDASKWVSIWPPYHPVEEYLEIWRREGTGTFGCVYQGDPTMLGGGIFGPWKQYPGDRPDWGNMHCVIYADVGFSEKETADFTAIAVVYFDPRDGRLYLRHMYRARLTEVGIENALCELIENYRPTLWAVEDNNFKTKIVQSIVANVTKRTRVPGRGILVDKDKVTRAHTPAARSEAGFLYVDREADWFPVFDAETRPFPNSEHDDQVDAISGAVALAEDNIMIARPQQTYHFGHEQPRASKWGTWENAR